MRVGVLLFCCALAGAQSRPAEIETLVIDNFERGTAETIHRRVRDGAAVTEAEARLSPRAAAGAGCSATGEQNVAVILVTFPGASTVVNADVARRAILDDRFLSVNTWYRDASYGKTSFTGSVFGPYALDRAYSCSETSAMRAAAIRAADADIDFTRFQRVVLIFPAIRDCPFGGMSTLGCSTHQTADGATPLSFIWLNSTTESGLRSLAAHELGHSLGVGHSRMLRTPASTLEADDYRAVPVEYGDKTAAMGSGTLGDFAAPHKLEFGWLDRDTDTATVESDGDFLVEPLGASSGLRALRVRRRPDADEWLWIEYRRMTGIAAGQSTALGFAGALVRRESKASGSKTDLLDMTPASLDGARLDQGASSEAWPELAPGEVWTDPHGPLSIHIGAVRSEGLEVSIRYDAPCAEPAMKQLTLNASGDPVSVDVAAAPECAWSVASGRTWLKAAREDGRAVVAATPLPDALTRRGLATVGRQTVAIRQAGPESAATLLSVTLPDGGLPVGAALPLVVRLRDDNGVDDMAVVEAELRPVDGEGSAPAEVLRYRVNATEVMLRVTVRIDDDGERLLYLRPVDLDGVAGDWIEAARLRPVEGCRVVPIYNLLQFLASGGANQRLTLQSAPAACAWSASSDAGWLRLAAAEGEGNLYFDIDANPDSSEREAFITVNGSRVRIVQFGRGELRPEYVTLLPEETLASSLGGTGMLAFSYGLAELIPAVPESDWVRVSRVLHSADRYEVWYEYDANPAAESRLGFINAGGRIFSILQAASTGN